MNTKLVWQEFIHRKADLRFWFGLLFIVFALMEYGIRGPARAPTNSGDFAGPYAATRVFWEHANPYDDFLLTQALGKNAVNARLESHYPPHTLVLLFPFVMFSWQQAKIVMAFVNTLLPLVAVLFFVFAPSFRTQSLLKKVCCILVFLLWAPLHTGIALGQLAVLSFALGFVAIQLASAGYSKSAGIVLAASLFAKPHLAFLLPLYFLLRRWYRSIWMCLAIFVMVSLFIVGWWRDKMGFFLKSLLEHLQERSVSGSLSASGPYFFERIDLAPLWPSGSFILVFILGVAVILPLLRLFPKSYLMEKESDRLLIQELGLACICLFTLVIVYHKYYDASLLLIPLAYAALRYDLSRSGRRVWALCFLLSIPFLAPISATISVLSRLIPEMSGALESSVPLRLVMLHLNITLLIILGYCLWALVTYFRKNAKNYILTDNEAVSVIGNDLRI
jgi:hypothetical protein